MSWFNATTWGQIQEKDKGGEKKEGHERLLHSNDNIIGPYDITDREKVVRT